MGLHLDRHRSIAEVAKLSGVPFQQMKRRLLRIHNDSGGQLLQKLSRSPRGKWYVTIRAIKKVMPEIFDERPYTRDEVAELHRKQRVTERKLDELTKQFKDFRAKSWAWFNKPIKTDQSR